MYNIDLTDVRINGKKTVIFCASMDSSGRVELHLRNRQISRRMDTHGIIVVERFATFHYY